MRTLAGWCVNHRRLVLLIWAIVLVVSLGLSNAVGTAYSNSFTFPKTESSDAIKLLQASAPKDSGDTEQIVFATSGGAKVTDPDVKASIEQDDRRDPEAPPRGPGDEPVYARGGDPDQRRPNRGVHPGHARTGKQNLLTESEAKQFVATATSAEGPHLQVAVSGQLAELTNPQSFSGTGVGVLLAFVVLILVFGSFFAAILPIVSALFALGTAIGVIGLLTHVLKMPSISPILVLLIGLGVGVDYALFIVTRHRQGLVAGQPIESIDHQRREHVGPSRHVRRDHRLYRPARHVRPGRQLPLRPRRGGGDRGALHHDLGPDPAAGHVGLHRPQGHEPQSRSANLAENGPRIVGVGTNGFWPRWADRIQRRPAFFGTIALLVIVLHRPPLLLLAAGLDGPGQRPGRDDDAHGLRPVGQGLRAGLQRTAPAGLRGVDPG